MRKFTNKSSIVIGLALTLAGYGGAAKSDDDMGPMKYDASGSMPCSAGAPTFDKACGWRVLRKPGGGAEIWISNIAVSDKPAYRVLEFSEGEFTARDGAQVQTAKDADTWSVTVNENEHYRFAGALITGG